VFTTIRLAKSLNHQQGKERNMPIKNSETTAATAKSVAAKQITFFARRLEGGVLSTLLIIAPSSAIDSPHRRAAIEAILQQHQGADHEPSALH
jgi:hypothetical protein